MTTWLTKELTLDLLAITIDGLNKAFNAISGDAPSTPLSVLEPKHPADEPQQPAPTPEAEQHPADPQAAAPAAPAEAPETAPASTTDLPMVHVGAPTADELHAQAQTLLRTISMDEGAAWITGVLFPKYGVQSLTAVQPGQLPALVEDAQAHIDEKAAA